MADLTLAALGLNPEAHSHLSSEHAHLVAATLDVDRPDSNEPLPLLWHWAFFNPVVPTSALGPDGHPLRDHPLMERFPRRMWVGGTVHASKPLHADRPTIRRTRLVDHTVKHGSSGELLVVSLEHIVEQDGAAIIVERQDIIYRTGDGVTSPPGDPIEIANGGDWSEVVTPSNALLFRFSAVTFNTHRIHYDRDYAVDVEHYPALVVHAPLTAMLLAGSATRALGQPIDSFSYRAAAPLFVDDEIRIRGTRTVDAKVAGAEMAAIRSDGVTAMTATAS